MALRARVSATVGADYQRKCFGARGALKVKNIG